MAHCQFSQARSPVKPAAIGAPTARRAPGRRRGDGDSRPSGRRPGSRMAGPGCAAEVGLACTIYAVIAGLFMISSGRSRHRKPRLFTTAAGIGPAMAGCSAPAGTPYRNCGSPTGSVRLVRDTSTSTALTSGSRRRPAAGLRRIGYEHVLAPFPGNVIKEQRESRASEYLAGRNPGRPCLGNSSSPAIGIRSAADESSRPGTGILQRHYLNVRNARATGMPASAGMPTCARRFLSSPNKPLVTEKNLAYVYCVARTQLLLSVYRVNPKLRKAQHRLLAARASGGCIQNPMKGEPWQIRSQQESRPRGTG